MHFLDNRTKKISNDDIIRISSTQDGPRYFYFNDLIDDSTDQARERARLKLEFEKKLDEFFVGKPITIIELD